MSETIGTRGLNVLLEHLAGVPDAYEKPGLRSAVCLKAALGVRRKVGTRSANGSAAQSKQPLPKGLVNVAGTPRPTTESCTDIRGP